MIRIIRFLIVLLKKVDFPMFQINVPKKYYKHTQNMLYLSLLPRSQKLFGIARCQERGSIVCIHRRTEEATTKVYIFVYKIFTNSIFKSYTAIAVGFHTLEKWCHYKLKLLQNSIISVLVIWTSDITPTSQTRSVLRPRAILLSTDSKNSCYCIITKRTYN